MFSHYPWALDLPAPEMNQLFEPRLLQAYADAGIQGLGLGASFIMHNDTQDIDLIRLRTQVEAYNLRFATSHPFFGSWNNAFSTATQNPGRLRFELAWMEEFIRRCGLLGVRAIPLHTGGALLPGAEAWEIQRIKDYLEALLPMARSTGVTLAVENTNHAKPDRWAEGHTDNTVTDERAWRHDDPKLDVEVVQSFDDAHVGLCYDIGHAHLQGEALSTLERFLPYIALYHLHDNGGDWHDSHLQPGYGTTPWFEVFSMMQTGAPDAPWYIEARPQSGHPGRLVEELEALVLGQVKPGGQGFYPKDRLTGRLCLPGEARYEPGVQRPEAHPPSTILDLDHHAAEGLSGLAFETLCQKVDAYLTERDRSKPQVLLMNSPGDSPFILAMISEALGLGGLALNVANEDRRARSREAAILLRPMIQMWVDDEDWIWHKQRPIDAPDDSQRYLEMPMEAFKDGRLSVRTGELETVIWEIFRP